MYLFICLKILSNLHLKVKCVKIKCRINNIKSHYSIILSLNQAILRYSVYELADG